MDRIEGCLDGAAIFAEGWREGWRMPPATSVTEWSERNVVLAGKTASEPGPYRVSRTPYAREPMDHMSARSSVREIVLLWGSQTSKSTIANNCVGYWVDVEPGPMLFVQPTLDLAKRYSRQRISTLIEATDVLREKFADNRSRDEANTLLMKEFPGGCLVLAGANSAAGLRMMPARYLLKDEIDGYPADVDGEGDPCELADKRQSTFGDRARTITTSTPGDDISSRIGPKFDSGSRGRYHVPCPHCGGLQALKWANLVWLEGDPSSVRYRCEHCGALLEEHRKSTMLAELGHGGEARWIHEDPAAEVKSYHLSSLYSPLGWTSWVTLVKEFLEAKKAADQGDPTKLKTFVNTRLAETWKDQGEQVEADALELRAKRGHELASVPAGALILTAGADVQGNRIELAVKAWGRGEESWLVDYLVLWGEPADLLSGKDPRLDEAERRAYRNVHGRDLRIAATAIDSGGHNTQDVYMHTRRRRQAQHVIAVKGHSEGWRPILGRPTDVEINWRGEKIKRGAQVWLVGSDTAKDVIYNRLRRVKEPGPGYLHFPREGLPEGYFQGLTSEKLITRYNKGRPRREWYLPKGKRNEPLDCEVYAMAAAHYAGVMRMRDADWDRLERMLQPDLFSSPTPTRDDSADSKEPPAGAHEAPASIPREQDVAAPATQKSPAPARAPSSRPAKIPGRNFATGWKNRN